MSNAARKGGRVHGRAPRFVDALPSYLGGKRRLLGHIAKALPPPEDSPVLADPFLGGGSVSLWAKRRGFQVTCNDIAFRSVLVGRALVANDRVRLAREDVTRLFAVEPNGAPGFVEHVYGGEVLPVRHARFLDGALPVARSRPEPKRSLLLLLLMRYALALRPMGNFGARRIVEQMDAGDWESVNPTFLRDHLTRRIESHPRTLCLELMASINAGVFGNGGKNEVCQGDAVEFLRRVEADVAYLDSPYSGTSAYESALRPLDSILAGEPVAARPSVFSGRHAIEALDELLDACRRIPRLVISYGNAVLDDDGLGRLVGRHRREVRVQSIQYTHLAGLASAESKVRNAELLVRAEGPR